MHAMYEQHLAPYDLDSSQERTSRGIDDELVVAIAHFNRWLLQIATDINERQWSLLPIAGHQVSFFGIDSTCVWAILKAKHIQHPAAMGKVV